MTHDLWDELSRHIGQFLGAVTLADVLARQLQGKADEIARYRSAAAE
jgi:DNA-binding IscR family transcriptional regulator